MPCSVCQHPERQAIDLALLNRTATLAALGKQYNLSTSALHRHKQHLLQKVRQAENRFHSMFNEGCLCILYHFLEVLLGIIGTARAEGNVRQLLQATRQGAGIIKFMPKLGLDLHPDTLYRLLDSPLGAETESLLPADLKFFAAARRDLANHLLAACPEPGAAADQALDDPAVLADLQELTPELLHDLLPDLPRSLGLAGEARTSASREKSGKLAGKNHDKGKKGQGYRKPVFNGKMFEKNWDTGSNNRAADLAAARLDITALAAIGAGRPAPEVLPEFLAAAEAASGAAHLVAA